MVRMPLVKPVRDLKTVRCVRRYKDKNGETKYNLRVLFNYVDILSLSFLSVEFNLYFYVLKADPQWNLTREEVSSAKELFKIYDTDNDGVITYHQVKSAMKVLGHRFRGFGKRHWKKDFSKRNFSLLRRRASPECLSVFRL